ncbi:MAG: hypothetical protein KME06_07970 [Kastovskya adunca ATA6-11-RM4]|jgi:hypothetical protein|nr:hypothetical protein [Kastovskya adunca ATA6-11-RM4]
MPNLLEATKEYWKKLDQLEAAYKRDEVSLEEVDTRVSELMAELGDERRAALNYVWLGARRFWNEQRETVVGVAFLGILTYAWAIVSQAA